MKTLKNNASIKKIIISLLLAILLTNFVMPNYVQAGFWENADDVAGKLTVPIFSFINWLGDKVIETLQGAFLGYGEINDDDGDVYEDERYHITYSPKAIFSGRVPALNINFIEEPKEIKIASLKWDLVEWFDGYGENDADYAAEKDITNILRNCGYSGPKHEELNMGNASSNVGENRSATFKVGETEYTYEEFCNYIKIAYNNANSENTKEVGNDVIGYAPMYEIVQFTVEGNENIYHIYTEDDYGYLFLTVNDSLTGLELGACGAAAEREKEFVKIVKEKLAESLSLSEEQISAGDGLEEYYRELREQGLFGYNWLQDNIGLEWTSSIDGKTYKIKDSDLYIGVFVKGNSTKTLTSTVGEIRDEIATWYKALRTLALVGLLSVLVYVGIRIIISSASEDKAKYKKMLMNWFAAICILFLLHYIMVFMVNITQQITNIFLGATSNAPLEVEEGRIYYINELFDEDEILSNIRNHIEESGEDNLTSAVGNTVVYCALVIYTVIFTIQYLKRVIYVAFLTMIAPLIALTYPIDKIKDGKAQAFSMWLKEYIFNCLLQPVHLLLYYMLIGGMASDFLESNPIYAVVAVSFLVPAEKFFRKMFGMESQTSVGTIGAAAGGAMVMSMLSKLKGKPPKDEAEQQPKVRTANQTPSTATRTGSSSRTDTDSSSGSGAGSGLGFRADTDSSSGSGAGSGLGSRADTGSSLGSNSRAGSGSRANTGSSSSSGAGSGLGFRVDTDSSSGSGAGSGAGSGSSVTPVTGQSWTRGVANVAKTHLGTKDAWKRHGRRARRTIVGAAGGLAGATIGLAAGVATGDLGNAVKYAGAGAVAGAYATNNLTDKGVIGASHIKRDYQKGAMGTEAYNNAQFDKQFFKSDDYAMIAEDLQIAANGIDPKSAVQGYLDQGVTDGTQIRKLLQKNITPDVYKKWADKSMKDPDKIRQLEKAKIGVDDYEKYVNVGIRDVDKMEDLAKAGIKAEKYAELASAGMTNVNTIRKHKAKTAEELKKMRRIVKYGEDAIKNMNQNDVKEIDGVKVPRTFYNYASNFGADDNMIKETWNNLEDFM